MWKPPPGRWNSSKSQQMGDSVSTRGGAGGHGAQLDFIAGVHPTTGMGIARLRMRTAISMPLWLGVALTCLLRAPGPAVAATPEVRYEPAPSWVEYRQLDVAGEVPTDELRDGVYILLFERQTRIGAIEAETFERFARRIVTQPGVDAASQITIEFDPTYQRLDIHWVRIRRGTENLDALNPAAIRLLQRETDLEYGIYDGTFTATLELEDVRVGDIVDYSFTIRGQNPVFAGHYMDQLWNASRHPYRHLRFRLLWPNSRDLYIKDHGRAGTPVIRRLGEHTEYVWEFENTKPVTPESDLPDWYDWQAWTQLSDYRDWAEVAAWGASIYTASPQRSESVRALANQISAEHDAPRDRLLAALRFVQDEVRYLGIEIGPSSHQPHDPELVMRRRFGDCKDKSLLLIQLLSELGIDAAAALVNTELRTHVESWQPSPFGFDHVVVRATIDDQVIWVDPTLSYEGGGLNGWRYETAALTLSPQTTGLEIIPKRESSEATTRVEYSFDSPDIESPTTLTIATFATAEAANELRALFLSTSRDEIRRKYLDYYARMYSNIESVGKIEFEDDRPNNLVRVREQYRIDGFWKTLDHDKWKARYYPMEMMSRISTPDTVNRTMPIGRAFPDHVAVEIKATLPVDFAFMEDTRIIEDPAFRFQWKKTIDSRGLELFYEYESLADSVSPSQAADYLKRIDETRGLLSTGLWMRPNGGFWTPRGIGFAGFLPIYLLLMASPVLRVLASRAYLSKGNVKRSIGYAVWAHRMALVSFRPILHRAAIAVYLSQLKAMAGDFAEAEELATAALRRTPNGGRLANAIHRDALYALSILRVRQKRLDEASDYLTRAEQAAELLPEGKPTQRAFRKLQRVSINASLGNTKGANETISEAESLARGDRYVAYMSAFTRAEVLEADGQTDEAGLLLRRNLRTAEETFGSGHFFTQEIKRGLQEFEERQGRCSSR